MASIDAASRKDGSGGTDSRASPRWALASLSLSMLLSSSGTSIANVALPTLAQQFSASIQQVQWVVLAYLLAITTLVVGVGRLGDIIGRRRLMLSGIGLFTFASILCGIAPGLSWLIAARAVQGLGAAIMMALSMALVGETVAKARTGSAMGMLATMSAIGTALGPSLGGLLIAGPGWRAIFLVIAPLGILTMILAFRGLPRARRESAAGYASFDIPGTLLLASTLAAYALAMTVGRGSFGSLNLLLLLAAAFGAGMFVLVERRVRSPLIRPAMFRDRILSAGLVASMLVSTVMMATLVVGPFYLADGLGLDAARLGLVMSIGPVISALSGIPAGRIVDRLGAPSVVVIGLVQMAAGSIAMIVLPTMWGIAGYVLAMVMLTPGYQLFQAANNTSVMADVDAAQRGVTSGMLNLARNLGLISGASVMGAVYAVALSAADAAATPARAVALGLQATFAAATALIVVALVLMTVARALASRSSSGREAR